MGILLCISLMLFVTCQFFNSSSKFTVRFFSSTSSDASASSDTSSKSSCPSSPHEKMYSSSISESWESEHSEHESSPILFSDTSCNDW